MMKQSMREKDSQTIDREKGREKRKPAGQCSFEYNSLEYETRARA
jgi:hypothetical protein